MISFAIDCAVDPNHKPARIMQVSSWFISNKHYSRERADGYYYISRAGNMKSFEAYKNKYSTSMMFRFKKDCI